MEGTPKQRTSRERQRLWRDYFGLFLGAFLTALALDLFLIPNKIAAGGVSGLATVIYYLLKVPAGVTMLAINIPLFLGGWRMLGTRFGIRTIFGAVFLSLFVDGLAPYLPPLTQDPLLAAIYGGALSGVGLGLTFRHGGSTGGTDLGAQMLHRVLKTSSGLALMAIDFGVIVLAGVVFRAELALYALISLFITTQAIDIVQEGVSLARAIYIISERNPEIAREILTRMDRGVTALSGRGLYTGREREVLFVIVARSEIHELKELVHDLDPEAFVIITDAHEVLGEGFKRD